MRFGFILGLFAAAALAQPAVAKSCGFRWAVPGYYEISGNFRGRVESMTARLTSDCRIVLQLPGVFTGGALSRSGQCLKFFFKVQGEKRAFSGRWCDRHGYVPWQGKTVRATVKRRF